MQSEGYKECLKDALEKLVKANESIYNCMIDILMQGEMKEWNDQVPIGEVHNFEYELFKNSTDTNIQLLVKLMETIDGTYNSIKNINSIKMDDDDDDEKE